MEQLEIGKVDEKWTVKLLRNRLKVHLFAKEEAERQSYSRESKSNINFTPNRNNIPLNQYNPRTLKSRPKQINYSTTSTLASYTRPTNFKRPIKSFPSSKTCRFCQGNHFLMNVKNIQI